MQDRFKFRVWKGQENRMVYDVTYLNPLILDPAIKEENKHNILMQLNYTFRRLKWVKIISIKSKYGFYVYKRKNQ